MCVPPPSCLFLCLCLCQLCELHFYKEAHRLHGCLQELRVGVPLASCESAIGPRSALAFLACSTLNLNHYDSPMGPSTPSALSTHAHASGHSTKFSKVALLGWAFGHPSWFASISHINARGVK